MRFLIVPSNLALKSLLASIAVAVCVLASAIPATAQQGARLYVPNSGSDDISVYTVNDSGGLDLLTTIALNPGDNPIKAVVRNDQAFVYVTNNGSGEVVVIDTKTNIVIQTIASGGGPFGMAVSPDGTRVYVAKNTSGQDTVQVFNADPRTGLLADAGTPIGTGFPTRPRHVALSPDGSRLYIVLQDSEQLRVVETITLTDVATIATPSSSGLPQDVAVSPDGTRVYVVSNPGEIFAIDATDNTLIATVTETFQDMRSVAFSPDGTVVYAVSYSDSRIYQVDVASNTFLDPVNVTPGDRPSGIVVSPNGQHAYVTGHNPSQSSIRVLSVGGIDNLLTLDGAAVVSGISPEFPGMCEPRANALLAPGATFVANAAAAFGCFGPTTPTFTGGTLLVNDTGLTLETAMTLASGGGTIDTNGYDATVTGVLSGDGGLTKTGAGTLVLAGAHTYTGATIVDGGALRVTGSTDAASTVIVASSGLAVLEGSGTLGAVRIDAGGRLSPGVPATAPGTLTVATLTLQGGGVFAAGLHGTSPAQYDHLVVSGTVVLDGAQLTVSADMGLVAGQVFTLIDNRGAQPVMGEFDGVPNGEVLFLGGQVLVLLYDGGDGNDVTLTVLTFPTLSTIASPGVPFGGAIHDTATLAGGVSPTGTIRFRLYGPDDATCARGPIFSNFQAVAGNGTYASASFTPVAAGTYRWVARYNGDAVNGEVLAACSGPNTSVVIAKASQSLTIDPVAPKTFGDAPFTVTATATSTLPVAVSSLTPAVCTVSGDTVTIVAAGTCTIAVDQAGDGNHEPAPQATQSVTVAQASQTITFGALGGKTFGDAPFDVSAAGGGSGQAVTFSSTTTTVCIVSGSTVTVVAAGTCTIAADQAGSSTYSAAPQMPQTFTVARASQTITFGALGGKTFGDAPFDVSAAGGGSGQTVTFSSTTTTVCRVSGSTVTVVAAGTCTIAADQAGSSNYSAAPQVPQTFTVARASQTIALDALGGRTFGDPAFTVGATASSGLPVAFSSTTTGVCTVSGATVTIIAAGACTIAADQAGDGNYEPAPRVTAGVTVAIADQTIAFAALSGKTFGDAPFAVSATAGFGLAVTFSSTTPGVCTVASATVTIVAAGACTLAADQAGTANVTPAPQVTQTFTVAQASQTIAVDLLPSKTLGDPAFTVNATATSGLPVTLTSLTPGVCTVAGRTVTIGAAGPCTVAADQAGNSNYHAAPQVTRSVAVAKVSQTITFGALPSKTLGDPAFAVSATASSGLTVTFTSLTTGVCMVSGGTVTIGAIGTCTLAADQIGNGNYSAAPAVTRSFFVAANCAIVTVGPAQLPLGVVGLPYSQAFSLTGGPAPATFTLTGAMPAGLTFSDGTISGTPTARGAVPIAITGTDAHACQATVSVSLAVSAERRLVVGAGAGGPATVRAFTVASPVLAADFTAFASPFTGGVSVAQGDVNGDGVADIVTGAGPGGAPTVKVFDATGGLRLSFLAFESAFDTGIEVAAGDITGDGIPEILVTGGCAGPFVVRAFNGVTGTLVREYPVTGPVWSCGLHLAAGDVNGDGLADLVLGSGGVSAPFVQVISGASGAVLRDFYAYDLGFTAGVYVAAADITGDGVADIVTGAGPGGGPHVRVFDGATGAAITGPLAGFMAYDPAFLGGVRVAAGDLNGDGRAELITGPGPGGGPHVRVWDGASATEIFGVLALDPAFTGGVFLAGPPATGRMTIDLATGAGGAIRIAGWALREGLGHTNGTDAVHAWAFPVGGGAPVFVGATSDRGVRPDVAALFGGEFLRSGFDLAGTLTPGTYDLVVYVRNSRTLRFDQARVVRITVP